MSSGPRRLILDVSMKGPCLVTGANGHVGYNLVQALVARGYEVRATVRDRDNPDTAGPLREIPNVEVESLDVRDGEAFRQVAEGIDTLFHVAATYKYIFATEAQEDSMIRDSVEGARAAILAAAANGGSNSGARRELGWSPEIPFEHSLQDTMDALKSFDAASRDRRK